MNNNDTLLSADTGKTVAEKLFREYLGVSFDDVVLSNFLEQSARYLGVFYEQDPLQEKDEKYLIN